MGTGITVTISRISGKIEWHVLNAQGEPEDSGESETFGAGATAALAAFKKYLASQVTNLQSLSGSV